MKSGFSSSGADLLGNLTKRVQEVATAGDRGLYLGGQHILNVSNRQVPHEEGDLERDGAVIQGSGEVAITYGRDAQVAAYAERQHEDLSLAHDSGRNAKFLENAMNSEREKVLAIIADTTRKAWGG